MDSQVSITISKSIFDPPDSYHHFPLGIMRAFLVYPTYIVFPNLLPTVQLFDALHRGKKIFTQKKRVNFFWGVFIAIFVWEWFPEYIAPWVLGIKILDFGFNSMRSGLWRVSVFSVLLEETAIGWLVFLVSSLHLRCCIINELIWYFRRWGCG